MRLEIYNEKPKDQEKVVRLRLIEQYKGEITVVAVRDDGTMDGCAYLLDFHSESRRIRLRAGVNPNLGFNLDKKGRIEIEDA